MAWAPPATRVPASGLWTPGILGGIPSRTSIYTTLSPTGDSTDRTSTINTALTNAGANEVVYLNAGTYYINGTITIPTNKVLRGAGIDATYLRKVGSGKTVISMGASVPWGPTTFNMDEWEEITSGFGKDSSAVVVADASGYATDQMALVTQADGANPDVTIGDATWSKIAGAGTPMNDYCSIGEIKLISSVAGTTINLSTPLYYNYSDTYTVSIRRLASSVRNAGVEDLTIYREEAAVNNNSYDTGAVWMCRAVYCWVKNVKLDKVSGPGIHPVFSYGCIVHGCDLQETYHYTSGGGGYLMTLKLYSSDILIENNIIRQSNANLQFETAGAGCVIAYNWMDVAVTSGGTSWSIYSISGHASTPHMVLLEGNQVSEIENDATHGNSIYWFALRNECDIKETEFTSPLDDSMCTDNLSGFNLYDDGHYWSIVGNVLGRSGDGYGDYQSEIHGSSTAYIYRKVAGVQTTLLRHGNYDYYYNAVKWGIEGNSEADLQGTSNDQDLPKSLYLTSKPDFFGNIPWPSIGPDKSPVVTDIPAKRRYDGGSYPYASGDKLVLVLN